MTTRAIAPLFALVLTACTGLVGQPLHADAAGRLHDAGEHPDSLGDLIYEGRVQARGDDADALFRYERRVERVDDGWVGSHITYNTNEVPVVLQIATYTDAYELLSFEEIHGQTGLVGEATVNADGDLELDWAQGGEADSSLESDDDPVHVGPSLFGFALENWDAMLAGESRYLGFVVMDAGRTYRFKLRLESTDSETTVFRMTATDALVRLAVSAMRISFDTDSRAPIRYEGLVPPMTGPSDNLRKLDARVDYVNVSDDYR